MEMQETADSSIAELAWVAPAIRGLLANPTGNADMPYDPVILKGLAGKEAVVFASSPDRAGQRPPPEIEGLDTPPLYLDIPGNIESATTLREELDTAFEQYVAQQGAKPQVICLRDLGLLYVSEEPTEAGGPLRNKVALVTGAAGAIGHGICRGLLDQGCYVAATDLPGERLDNLVQEFAERVQDRILGVPLDVTDQDSVARGFQRVIEAWGGVDIVIVNAGIALVSPLVEMDLAAFQRVERVNVEGTLLTISEAGRLLTLQGTGGDIVLISTKNVFAPGANFGAYSATKAASHQLARIASLELAPFAIRVNMVAPDAIFSDGQYKSGLWAEVGPDRMKARGLDEKGLEEYYHSRNLLKAKVTARHVANAVLFFVTHQTPTTGATIPVDGGLPDATPR
ncbi:MAG: SDR family oxidoreductase [Chloroflexota bacterium]|nr:SDR family oxidoreductase [Chloroflexota bacterium]